MPPFHPGAWILVRTLLRTVLWLLRSGQVRVAPVGSLPPTEKAQIEFLAPGNSLGQPHAFQAFKGWIVDGSSLSVLYIPNSQLKKKKSLPIISIPGSNFNTPNSRLKKHYLKHICELEREQSHRFNDSTQILLAAVLKSCFRFVVNWVIPGVWVSGWCQCQGELAEWLMALAYDFRGSH